MLQSRRRMIAACVSVATSLIAVSTVHAQRAEGIDVSAWQGTINWTTVARAEALGGGGKQFAFIRSSRGGTTGFYNQSDPNNNNNLNTLSQRYDDPFFVSNITNATANGMLAGPYHFGRLDIIATTVNANGIANNGTDEANHMIEQAGAWMKPGYLLPVFDLESGQAELTSAQLSQFAVDFSNRIFAVKGVRPIVYCSQNYANYVNTTVPAAYPNLWIARWPNQSNPESIDIQNINPPPSPAGSNVYGKWNPTFPAIPNPAPWTIWQYASTINVPGIGGGTANVDGDVANGDIEYMKDFLVPALWQNDNSGTWTTTSNWNTALDASGQGPAGRLPGQTTAGLNDTVTLDRPAAAITVTVPSGSYSMRRLFNQETLTLTGGTLNVSRHARLSNTTNFNGGALNVTGSGSLENNGAINSTNGGTIAAATFIGTGSINATGGVLTVGKVRQANLTTQGTGVVRFVSAGTTSVSVFNSVTHTAGQIDLGDEAMVINYTGTSPAGALRADLLAGYANGDWNGQGIISTPAAADVSRSLAIGYAEATDLGSPATFLGQTIDSTSLLLRSTLYGDANLTRTVDLDDFTALASNFGLIGRWSKGDFDYNGLVDLNDFTLLASQFGKSLPTDLPRGSAIPEPAGLLALAAIVATLRRNR